MTARKPHCAASTGKRPTTAVAFSYSICASASPPARIFALPLSFDMSYEYVLPDDSAASLHVPDQVSRHQSSIGAGAAPGLLPDHPARRESVGEKAGGLQQRPGVLGRHQLGHLGGVHLPIVPYCAARNPVHALFSGKIEFRAKGITHSF